MALSDGSLVAVSKDLVEEMPTQSQVPILEMALSADENTLACFTKRGHVEIFDVVGKNCIAVIDTKTQKQPNQLIWCGLRVRRVLSDNLVASLDWSYFAPLTGHIVHSDAGSRAGVEHDRNVLREC